MRWMCLLAVLAALTVSSVQAEESATQNSIVPLTCPAEVDATALPADSSDVSPSLGFTRCKSTKDDVEAKYGNPFMQNNGPSGTSTYVYQFKGGAVVVVFLFAKDARILRTVAYAHNQ
ncbi:MAG TPA: hypothetical protein VKB71_19515 [Rhizomicrobium sp.]|nr:hypothetical protein [Rhizomicrobium sp.]